MQYKSFTIDHIVPKRRNDIYQYLKTYHPNIIKGSDTIENLNPCCNSCNSSKATFTIEKWKNEIKQKHDRLLKNNATYRLLHRFKIIEKINIEIKLYKNGTR